MKTNQVNALRDLIELKLNTPLQNSNASQLFDNYLKNWLKAAYPKEKEAQGIYQSIVSACGLKSETDDNEIKIDPSMLKGNKFAALITEDGLLWLLLLSASPVTSCFPVQYKIKAYIELAKKSYHGEIGDKAKYLMTQAIALSALSVAAKSQQEDLLNETKKYFLPGVAPENKLLKQPNKNYGDWIVEKTKEHTRTNAQKEAEAQKIIAALIQAATFKEEDTKVLLEKQPSNATIPMTHELAEPDIIADFATKPLPLNEVKAESKSVLTQEPSLKGFAGVQTPKKEERAISLIEAPDPTEALSLKSKNKIKKSPFWRLALAVIAGGIAMGVGAGLVMLGILMPLGLVASLPTLGIILGAFGLIGGVISGVVSHFLNKKSPPSTPAYERFASEEMNASQDECSSHARCLKAGLLKQHSLQSISLSAKTKTMPSKSTFRSLPKMPVTQDHDEADSLPLSWAGM